MVDFDCIAARVVPGQTDSIAGQFTLDGNQLHWAPLDPANGQSFRVALEAVKGEACSSSVYSSLLLFPDVAQKVLAPTQVHFRRPDQSHRCGFQLSLGPSCWSSRPWRSVTQQ